MRSKRRSKGDSPAAGSLRRWPFAFAPVGVLMGAPLIALFPMLTVRVFPFVAPNEEPKWLVLTLCGLLMGFGAAWYWWQRERPLAVSASVPGMLLILFLALLGIGIFIGPNKIEGLIRYTFWLISASVFLLAVWAVRNEHRWLDALIWSASVASLVFSLGYWRSYLLDFGKPGYNVSVLFSPIGHVNFTGDVLVVLLPAMVWMLMAKANPILRVMNWFSVFTMATVLLVAAGRGALGGLALGVIVLLLVSARHIRTIRGQRMFSWERAQPAIWAASALLIAVIVNSALPYHYRELVRISGTLAAAAEIKAPKQLTPNVPQPPFAQFWMDLYPVLTDRTPMYAAATAMALDAPWLGQGTGNFAYVYPAWSNRFPDFRDPLSTDRTFTTNPHNIILQLATQNGWIAALIFLILLLSLWWRLARCVWRAWDGWLAAGVVGVTAAIFDAMFNHVFFNPASMFVFALFAGTWWASARVGRPKVLFQSRWRWSKPLAVGMAVISMLLAIWPIRWIVSEWHVGKAMAHAARPPLAKVEYEKAYAWDPYNFRAVFGMAQSNYNARRYDQAIAYLKEFERIYPYNPPALNMLGAAYLMKGDLKAAAEAFEKALRILPGFKMAEQNLQRIRLLRMRH